MKKKRRLVKIQKPVANLSLKFEERKISWEKSQMVKKICTLDELPPMKHESHNFAWLGTSKTERQSYVSPNRQSHEMPDAIIYHLGLYSNCTLLNNHICVRKKMIGIKKCLIASWHVFWIICPWLSISFSTRQIHISVEFLVW